MFKYVILACYFMSSQIALSHIKPSILIYGDEGTSSEGINHLIKTLSEVLKDQYQVSTISHLEILEDSVLQNSKLLIFPGGRDQPYHKKLQGYGNYKIKKYVEKGGNFLGICAGSYYGGSKVEFYLPNHKLNVIEDRELGFFPGAVRGPVFSGFLYNRPTGVRAAKLKWLDGKGLQPNEIFYSYYNGGGYFVKAESIPGVHVLANYETLGKTKAAIVETEVGKGKAILSAVHLEYNPYDLPIPRDLRLKSTYEQLRKVNQKRLSLFRHLLQRLDISLEPKMNSRDLTHLKPLQETTFPLG